MILPLIVHYAEQGTREANRYSSWESALADLRDDWETGPHVPPSQLRDYLDDVPEEDQGAVLQDLIALHLRLAWQAGCGPRLEAYLQAFGDEFEELSCPAVVPVDLVEDEFLARYSRPHGDTPWLAEYETCYPGRRDILERLESRVLAAGRYVKLRKRGQGAMGDVWEAYDRHLRRTVAIKQPKPELSDQVAALARFAEEARVTAGLEHAGIVPLHEYHQTAGDAPFYVMRLVSGRTLSEKIRDFHQPPRRFSPAERRLAWRELLQSFVAVCDAIEYAHARQILHRDLKPGNILVDDFGQSIILDWGMATRLPSQNSNGYAAPQEPSPRAMIAGTPQYMAPEQVDGAADARSDVFGLGAMLFEILANRPPYHWADGSPQIDQLGAVRLAQFPAPRSLNRLVPRALEAICLQALARDPDERYQSASDLAQDVRRYLAGEAVTAWTESVPKRVWRLLRRRRL